MYPFTNAGRLPLDGLNRANRDSLLTFAYICARQKSGTFDGDESTIEVNG
jgi:hypothetical protein